MKVHSTYDHPRNNISMANPLVSTSMLYGSSTLANEI
jgi:hypothetical protein